MWRLPSLVDIMPKKNMLDGCIRVSAVIGFMSLAFATYVSLQENIRQYTKRHRNPGDYSDTAMVGVWPSLHSGLALSSLYMLRYAAPSNRVSSTGICRGARLMDWYTTLLLGIAILFTLFLSGAPIFLAFPVCNSCWCLCDHRACRLSNVCKFNSRYSIDDIIGFYSAVSSLMGELLFRSGTMDVLFDSIDKLVGRVKGRQYVLVVVLSAVFGALSGVAMAVAAMLGRAIMPGMEARGYNSDIAAGLDCRGSKSCADHTTQPARYHRGFYRRCINRQVAHSRRYSWTASWWDFLDICFHSHRHGFIISTRRCGGRKSRRDRQVSRSWRCFALCHLSSLFFR